MDRRGGLEPAVVAPRASGRASAEDLTLEITTPAPPGPHGDPAGAPQETETALEPAPLPVAVPAESAGAPGALAAATPPAAPAAADGGAAATPPVAPAPADGSLDALTASVRRLLSRSWMPLLLLALVCSLSVGARVFQLGKPFEDSPGSGFIFDEKYYVNAARVIAGVPMQASDPYAQMFTADGAVTSPTGSDQNGEHPQLGKVVIAAGIRLLGDNGWGWRFTAVLFGTATLLLLYWLVRVAGGSSWLALGVASLGAVENLFLISSRIAVLDIYCLPFMLAGAAFYLRRQPVVAGLIFGIGSCIKEFCAYALVAMLMVEAGRFLFWAWDERQRRRQAAISGEPADAQATGGETAPRRRIDRGAAARRVAIPAVAVLVTVVSYFAVLSMLDRAVPPYHDGHRVDQNQSQICSYTLVFQGGCNHFAFMNQYAASLKGIKGIASYPWQFWVDVEQINYYTVTTTVTTGDKVTAVNTVIAFQGMINPVLLALALPAFAVNLWWAIRRRDELAMLACAWYVATWLPAQAFNLIGQRTTYIYYMVVTLPGIFIAVARLVGHRRVPRVVLGVWIGLLLAAFAILYPFRTLSGS